MPRCSLHALPTHYTTLLLKRNKQAEWRVADDGQSSIIFKFSEATNRPALDTAVDLNNAITIMHHGDKRVDMQVGRGVWSPDGESLTITDMDPESWKAAVAAISSGTLHATLRKKLLVGAEQPSIGERGGGRVDNTSPSSGELRGNLTMRMSSPGRFGVRLYVGEKLDSTSSTFVDVEPCPEQVVVDDAKTTGKSVGAESVLATLPRPFFSVEGVLSMPGDRWLKVSTSTVDTTVYAWDDRRCTPCNVNIRKQTGAHSRQI